MISHTLTANSAFARRVRAVALGKIAEVCQPIAADAAIRADRIVEQLYDNDRAEYRSKGGVKLLGSFTGRISGGGDFPVEIHLDSSADPKKVFALEFGSDPHSIDGAPLIFDRSQASSLTAGPKRRTRTVQSLVGGLVRTPHVDHPGNAPGRFMQQALSSAVQAKLRISRGLTVGGRR